MSHEKGSPAWKTRLPTAHGPSIPSKTRRPVRHTKSRGHIRGHPSMSLLQRKFCNGKNQKHFVSWSFRCGTVGPVFRYPHVPYSGQRKYLSALFSPSPHTCLSQVSILFPLSLTLASQHYTKHVMICTSPNLLSEGPKDLARETSSRCQLSSQSTVGRVPLSLQMTTHCSSWRVKFIPTLPVALARVAIWKNHVCGHWLYLGSGFGVLGTV